MYCKNNFTISEAMFDKMDFWLKWLKWNVSLRIGLYKPSQATPNETIGNASRNCAFVLKGNWSQVIPYIKMEE